MNSYGSYNIREVTLEDILNVSSIHMRAYQAMELDDKPINENVSLHVYNTIYTRQFNEVAKADPTSHSYFRACFNNERMAGFILFSGSSAYSQKAVISDLYVDPAFWRGGYGKALFNHASETLKKDGYKEVELETYSNYTNAVRFYHKMGGKISQNGGSNMSVQQHIFTFEL